VLYKDIKAAVLAVGFFSITLGNFQGCGFGFE